MFDLGDLLYTIQKNIIHVTPTAKSKKMDSYSYSMHWGTIILFFCGFVRG
jgi:hypothetical protein